MAATVVLVDDHPLIRRGIRGAFDGASDIEVVGEAGSGQAALRLIEAKRPDVVFLDIGLPDIDGIELLGRIRLASPHTRVVMLSVFAERCHVGPAMDGGASGFLTKTAEPQQLVEAVRDVLRGRTPLSAEAATQLVALMRGRQDGPPASLLTPREQEIWDIVARGATNSEVAQRLFISEHTVKYHVHNILRKLGAKRRTEAIYSQAKAQRH